MKYCDPRSTLEWDIARYRRCRDFATWLMYAASLISVILVASGPGRRRLQGVLILESDWIEPLVQLNGARRFNLQMCAISTQQHPIIVGYC